MTTIDREKRIEGIRNSLKRGDKSLIANRLDVHPVWISYVLGGRGVSERVLRAAEQLIAEREKSQTN